MRQLKGDQRALFPRVYSHFLFPEGVYIFVWTVLIILSDLIQKFQASSFDTDANANFISTRIVGIRPFRITEEATFSPEFSSCCEV